MSNDLSDALNRAAGARRQPAEPTPSGTPRKALLLRLDPDLHRRLKVLAAERGTTVQALGVEALEALVYEKVDVRVIPEPKQEPREIGPFRVKRSTIPPPAV